MQINYLRKIVEKEIEQIVYYLEGKLGLGKAIAAMDVPLFKKAEAFGGKFSLCLFSQTVFLIWPLISAREAVKMTVYLKTLLL